MTRIAEVRVVFPLVVVLSACGAPSTTTRDPELEAMLELARSGEYRTWSREPAPHRSAGPHSTVRTFINPTLEQSLRAGDTTFPVGSIALKELFDGPGTKRTGWAIDWKLEDGWRFFEGFDPSLNEYFLKGTDNGCAGCHRPGVDYLLTPLSAFGTTDP
ncbi:MAG: hypothetical protein JNM17_22490 [Archangium sp.]|nr:hypothetical protein [Archangium sp.]